MLESFVIVSLAASRTLLQRLLAELYFRFRRFCSAGTNKKKLFLWTMVAAQAADGAWCNIYSEGYIPYTSIPTWTYLQNSLAAAEALSLKMSSQGTSLK